MSTTTSSTEVHEVPQSEVPQTTTTENETGKVLNRKWLARGIGGAILVAAVTAGTTLWAGFAAL